MFEFSVIFKTYMLFLSFFTCSDHGFKARLLVYSWPYNVYFAFGLLCRNVKKHRVRLIPVAIGTTKQLVTVWTPTNKKKMEISYSIEKLASFLKKLYTSIK